MFAIFFIAPVLWLVLAPTKSDNALITSSPFSFGSFHNVAQAWKHLDAYSDHLYRRWIANTLIYSLSATAITLAISIPAGYGLALGKFPGRKLILTVTLVVMIMPAAALVLPIFLELNALHLIGSVFSVILPFSFFPFGIYLAYIYYATSIPSELLDAARVDGCGEWLTFRRVALPLAKPDRRARLLLQLRRQLEQLLPAVRRAGGLEPVPDHGRPLEPARLDAVVQPGGRRRRPVGQHLQAGARARDPPRGHSGRDRLPRLPARARARDTRRGGEAVAVAKVAFEAASKVYGDGTRALDKLDLVIEDGEFMVLVGPSGCGKTTALRMAAGLEDITDGVVRIGERVVNGLSPKSRDIAMVFQSYALYPHLTVYDNIAFALKIKKVPKDEIRRRVEEAARILDLEALLKQEAARALGRPAAARRDGPCDRSPAAGVPDGRAVVQPRREAARQDARRHQEDPDAISESRRSTSRMTRSRR